VADLLRVKSVIVCLKHRPDENVGRKLLYRKADRLRFKGDSDAHIVRGLIAILFAIYSGQRADEILRIDAQDVFRRLGLAEHLTRQRSNGFAAMAERIRADSHHALSNELTAE